MRLSSVEELRLGKERPTCHLYIECKKSDNKYWIFYVDISKLAPIGAIAVVDNDVQKKGLELISELYFLPMKRIFPPLAYSYQIARAKRNERDQFYKAQMQVLKSIEYSKDLKYFDQDKDLLFPVIVFDGKMFQCDIIEDEIELSEIDYVRYVSSGLPENNIQVCIDVMTLKYFPEYLDSLEREIKKYDK